MACDGLGRLLAGDRGHGDHSGDDGARQGLGAVHLLSADGREPLLLPRRRVGRGGLVDLGSADVYQPAGVEAGEPRRDDTAGHVRQRGRRLPVGLDLARRRHRGAGADLARIARPHRHHQRRAGARVLLVDAARDRVFLADAGLHRVLFHRASRDRRAPVQRHDGARGLRAVPRVLDADRHPSPVRRSAGWRASSSCMR